MVQGCDGLGLALEPCQELGVPGKVGAEQFDGDRPAQPGIQATVHIGHAPAADEFPEFIASIQDALTGHRDIVFPV
jgi:hypothetical protein